MPSARGGVVGVLVRLLAVALLALATGCADPAEPPSDRDVVPALHPSVDGYPEARVALTPAGGGRARRLAVKVADTPARHRHGLMEVEHLPAGTGMLFVFERDQRGGFWMRDTLVPLSIAYVDASGTVLVVRRMEPCPTPPPTGRCPAYPPDGAYRTALEVPRGWFDAHGIGAGATLEILGADPDG